MAKTKVYADFLKEVKASAPDLTHKQHQKIASKKYQKYKAARDRKAAQKAAKAKEGKDSAPKAEPKKISSDFDAGASSIIEQEILKNTVDLNRIQAVLSNHGVTGYQIHEGEREGPNVQVYVTAPGLRIPVTGFFRVFKVG